MTPCSNDLLHTLEERGFVHQCSDLEGLRAHLARGPISAYIGFDATADSLHVGHLQALMLLRWLQRDGHRPVLLVGGATTRIGDPSFRDSSRPMLDDASIQHNIAGIRDTLSHYVDLHDGANGGELVNNADWLDRMSYLDFLNQVGRHFTINRLMSFDAVRSRLEHSLSFQEFGYTLLQAYDFTELARRKDCTLQIGGADQWANIINGIDLSRRQGGPALYGLTMPLLTTADGKKMGKSAQGAVWLHPARLTAFDFWQFWRNTDDRDVQRFLGLFTELPMDEVRRLGALQGAELNEAKLVLAHEATRLAHGETAAQQCRQAAASALDGQGEREGLPTWAVDVARVKSGITLAEVAVEAGLTTSRSAARRLAQGGGLRLDGAPQPNADTPLPEEHNEWVLSAGRKRHVRVTARLTDPSA